MKIHKAAIAIEGDNKSIQMDTIEHDGKFWLVPLWIDNPTTKTTRPARIILLDSLQHQRSSPGSLGGEFAVNVPIPRDVLEGRVRQKQGFGANLYIVIEAPDLTFELSARKLH
jgi:hypothetical protein